ncbi:DUF5367 domain-containing protein [Phenylobacterium sp. LH3H17]|uniref:DUF5367 family protein n=1 Tax=Phenylobacterium sp. LH3H17 TaxID=2903901 RepID=UPI0020CA2046|nr:DUF5367 family protein [Phenylobacterium sp. LH3H17]UTP41298.1 DUF5367 domain-containing protein [Phenylobacterium sp. LH3H17]
MAGLATEDAAEAQSKGALHLYAWFLLRGSFVWAVSTGILRLLPSAWVDRPAWTLLVSGAISGAGLVVATLLFLRKIEERHRLAALASFVAPQMLLDAGVTVAFVQVLPNFPPGHAPLFGAFVLWCYAVMLMTAVIATRPRD